MRHEARAETTTEPREGSTRKHEQRVAELLRTWMPHTALTLDELELAMTAAWLHELPLARLVELQSLGIPERAVEVIALVHPPESDVGLGNFYRALEQDRVAVVLVAADRCAHLEAAREDLEIGRRRREWARYVLRVLRELHYLPWPSPFFEYEINVRLRAVEAVVPHIFGE